MIVDNLCKDSGIIYRMKKEIKNPYRIISDMEEKYGLRPGTLASNQSSKFLSRARRELVLQLRAIGLSFKDIGSYLNRNHSTIIRYVDKPVDKLGTSRGKRVKKSV